MGRGGSEAFDTGAPLDVRRLPIRDLRRVAHIGTLEASDKGSSFGGSWEGRGLSISLDPEAWERIARLGGGRWWALDNDSGRFIEAHRLTEEQREMIIDWGVDQGYVERIAAWRSTHFDEEGEEYFFLHEDREEVLLEVDFDGLEDEHERPVTETTALKPTPLLEEKLGMRSHLDCFDHLLVVYGEAMTAYDGVWWEDEYGHLSAPRGVIFPGNVGNWEPREITRGDWD